MPIRAHEDEVDVCAARGPRPLAKNVDRIERSRSVGEKVETRQEKTHTAAVAGGGVITPPHSGGARIFNNLNAGSMLERTAAAQNFAVRASIRTAEPATRQSESLN